jgi:multidrug efflux system membrane fusion protein
MKSTQPMLWSGPKRGLNIMCAFLALGFFSGACRRAPEMPAPTPPEVAVTTPVVRDVTVFHEFTGTTVASESVEIRARVQGFLERVSFEPSSFVGRGDVLFVIERGPYEAQRDQAQANMSSAEAALRRADSDLERLEQAVRTNAVSQQEVTRARAERDQASAALLQAKAALTNAEIQLSYTIIRSPIDGLVSRNLVDVGNLVGAGGSTLLATVRRIDPIYADFDMSERYMVQILDDRGGLRNPDQGSEVTATLLLKETGHEIQGKIDSFGNTVDPATGTIAVRAIFDNADARVFPGFFVHVRMPGQRLEGALLVEETAVGTDLGGRYVLVVGSDNVVERRSIEPGPLEADGYRVVLSGLEPGERYIVRGVQRARPGLPVSPSDAGSGS